MEALMKQRSYRIDILPRIEALADRFDLVHIGTIRKRRSCPTYPMFALMSRSRRGDMRPWVFVSGGVHGNEPAGAFGCLTFMEEQAARYEDRCRFVAVPCVNPGGFELATRENAHGQDVNRAFRRKTRVQEALILRRFFRRIRKRFLFVADMHEAYPDDGFFLWEICSDRKRRVGKSVVKAVRKIAPIEKSRKIDGDINSGGVIFYPEGAGNDEYSDYSTVEGYLCRFYTPQALTFETSTGWELERRIEVHVRAMCAALDDHPKMRKSRRGR